MKEYVLIKGRHTFGPVAVTGKDSWLLQLQYHQESPLCNGFKLACLNVNSLETNEIRNILTNSPLEVLSTNESKLDSTIVDNEVYVPDYSIIRKDCNRSAGGVALYIRENLSHKQTELI